MDNGFPFSTRNGIYIYKVHLGTEISTTKQLSENVAQPGIEPGSPDYRSGALTTQPLN